MPVNPSLYLIKYDGFDCVYGLELHKDERVQGLEVLPDRLGKEPGLQTLNKVENKTHKNLISTSHITVWLFLDVCSNVGPSC